MSEEKEKVVKMEPHYEKVPNEEVKGSDTDVETPTQEPPTYDQLIKAVREMSQYIQQLEAKLNDKIEYDIIRRIQLLFSVIEQKEQFDEAFVKECAKEIQDRITLPKEDK